MSENLVTLPELMLERVVVNESADDAVKVGGRLDWPYFEICQVILGGMECSPYKTG